MRIFPLLPLLVLGGALVAADVPKDPAPDDADVATFDGHRYRIYANESLGEEQTWHAAKRFCEARGGHLAVVTSQAEQDFVTTLCDGRYAWLGATDEEEEGTFVWVDGSEWDYTSWFPDQPNNWNDENFLATYDGGDWVDVHAEGDDYWMPGFFICEWESEERPTTVPDADEETEVEVEEEE